MASWVSLLLFLFCKSLARAQESTNILEYTSETPINNVVQDPQTGRIYLGAVNTIFQLGASLKLQARAETGPKEDARTCTPPASACQDTKPMPNLNKLLLVHPSNGTLIVCGSRYRGICSLRNLTNVEEQVYYRDSNGERTYVASIEDNVNVVGVMSTYIREGHTFSVFVVGKGYGSLDSTKLISTRILQDFREWVVFESIIEASTVQTTPFVPKYLHDFRLAFKEDGFVYFLFSRTLDGTDNKNLTFVSRLCEDDHHYYSHTELQLNCGLNNRYNKVQAAYVASPGTELARVMTDSGKYENKVLFMVASSDEDENDSALCMYPLNLINERLVDIISACYSDSGKIGGFPAVDIPYSSKTDEFCTSRIAKDTLEQFKCGADFLPSPLASKPKFALQADTVLTTKGLLTAVAVAVENEHTIAFLGNNQGEVLKVHLTAEAHVYSKAPGDTMGEKVNKNLFFDLSQSHLYITTEKKVLIHIPSLPFIGSSDRLMCIIKSFQSEGTMSGSGQVSCDLPSPSLIPQTPENQGYSDKDLNPFISHTSSMVQGMAMSICLVHTCKTNDNPIGLRGRDGHDISQRDRGAGGAGVQLLQLCRDGEEIRKHTGARCPQFENPDPGLIPVGYKIPISFEGINLDLYEGRVFTIGTELMRNVEEEVNIGEVQFYTFSGFSFSYDKSPETNVLFYVKDKESGKKMDSTLNVTLYNCSMGREDCSLCKNADPKYKCVWCAKQKACVYEMLCKSDQQGFHDPSSTECPDPQITDILPRFGPLRGGISITIRGSNLGIRKEDIKRITVAGQPCIHQEEKYSVSTSVVCEIGSSGTKAKWGQVEVEVNGGKKGISSLVFTYRDPIPQMVTPSRGPKAGGTLITISGQFLDTGSKDDVHVTIGTVDCTVEHFGREITCRTGEYRTDKVPSDLLPVTLTYGRSTVTTVPSAFRFLENPIVLDHQPKGSFVCGGRNIVVTGSGFDLIQTAVMMVQGDNMKAYEDYHEKNDTVIQFRSPTVNESLNQHFRTYIHLDNWVKELKPFDYHQNPVFDKLTKNVINEASIIIVTGRGFSRAMTAKEAQAFVGDVPCLVNTLQDDKLFLDPPSTPPRARSRRQRRDTRPELLDLMIKFGKGEWLVGLVQYEKKNDLSLYIIIPAVVVPMLLIIAISVYCYRRKSQQAEREYEKVKHQLENLEESVRDRCKKEFTDLMIEMEDHTNELSEGRIPFLDYKTYTDRVFFLPSKDGANDVMITGKLDIPEARRATVTQALNQFSNLLNSKTFLINVIMLHVGVSWTDQLRIQTDYVCTEQCCKGLTKRLGFCLNHSRCAFIRTLERSHDFNARAKVYFASLLTVALHGKLEYYTDIMRTLLLELMEEYVHSKNPKLMLRRSETVVERMLCNWMSICLYQFLKTLQVLVHGEGPDVTPVKVLNCDTISQVKEKIIEQVYRNLPYSQRPKVESVTLGNALLDDDKVFHLVRPADELDEIKSKRGSIKDKSMTKAITEIYLTRLLSVKGTLQQFVDDFFRSVLCSGAVVPPAVKYFFDFLDEQAQKHSVDDETIHIWKTNSLPLRFWVNILKNPHFTFDVHVSEVVDASLSVIAQTFMDACTKSEHKLSRVSGNRGGGGGGGGGDSPSNKLLYAKEISTYKKMVDDGLIYFDSFLKNLVKISLQTSWPALISVHCVYCDGHGKFVQSTLFNSHTDKLNTQVALHQLYQYASKYYDGIIASLDEDPAAQSKQLTLRLQQIAAALENKVTDL
ncbi:Plexin-B2 Precursor [Collichthys lucidus]|uniref:Plexin-B2 n=1 Tax=Collichthys lucidus TaxID=240159 RepID=A0A4U5UHP8_COLLU|nr:Plexin-B2 Precursor [Collichthys lucidus]